MKFRHTLLIVLLLFSLLPLYLLGVVMVYENDQNTEEVITESLGAVSKTQILAINNFCEARKEYMELIRQYEVVQDEVLISLGKKEPSGKYGYNYLQNMLEERARSNSFVASLSIIDAEFSVVASSEEYYRGQISEFKELDKTYQTGEFQLGNVYKREVAGSLQRLVAAYDGIFYGGELIGYIIEEIPVSYFNQYRQSVSKIASGRMHIVDGEGQYITVGLSKGGTEQGDSALTKEEQKNYYKLWNDIDWDKEHSGHYTYEAGGKKYLAYYSDIDYTSWKICINEDLSLYQGRTQRFRSLLIIMLCILSVALFIVNFYLSRRLTKPLGRIMQTLTKVRREHDYSLRVGKHGRDEFGSLSKEIDELLFFAEAAECREQEKQESLEREVEKDPLTGIYNKKAIDNYIEQAIKREAKKDGDIAIGFIDIDNFRDYNTMYGHQAGDEVICFVANTLKKQLGDGVGRNGGDEFLFCLTGFESQEKLVHHIEKLLKKLNDGFYNEKTGEKMSVPCSIGVTVAKASGTTNKAIIERADEAMYQTKENGKNGYSIL